MLYSVNFKEPNKLVITNNDEKQQLAIVQFSINKSR